MSRNLLLVVETHINGTDIKMKVDTGASRSIIIMETYKTITCKLDSLRYTNNKLRTFSGGVTKPEGTIGASFMYENQCLVVPFVVANTKDPNLLGRDVLRLLRFNWERLLNAYYVRTDNCLNKTLSEYKEIYRSKMATLKGFEVELTVDPGCKPKFCKARPVSYALNKRIKKKLKRLVKDGIYEPIQYCKWKAPIVLVLKDDGTVKVFWENKQTTNQAFLCDKYPVPKTKDLFVTLNGGEIFSKLCLSHAYQQLLLSPEPHPLLTVNSHKDLFQSKDSSFSNILHQGYFKGK